MDNSKKIIVTAEGLEESTSLRLDAYLAHQYAGEHSRSFLAACIKKGNVCVNGAAVFKPRHEVKVGDGITIVIAPPDAYAVEPQPVAFEVVAEEKDFLIINKPAGLVVHHSSTKPHEVTLVHGLLYRFPEFARFESDERPGIVHRLDKNTSGLLVVARTQQAHARLADLFKMRALIKEYRAVVLGHPPKSGTIEKPIGRHPVHRHKMAVDGIASRKARTEYEVALYYEKHALLKVRLVTGRTHQIRVHCAHIGHSLVGDATYGTSSHLISRHALHAAHLFFSYQGKTYTYTSQLPTDMEHLLQLLKPHEW